MPAAAVLSYYEAVHLVCDHVLRNWCLTWRLMLHRIRPVLPRNKPEVDTPPAVLVSLGRRVRAAARAGAWLRGAIAHARPPHFTST